MVLGVKVDPVAPGMRSVPSHLAVCSSLSAFCHRAWGLWYRTQIGHQQQYSVERLLALHDYCKRTSFARVIIVCVLALVPVFIVTILIECIPLRPPSEGWRANAAFWFRHFISAVLCAIGGMFTVRDGINPNVISDTRIVGSAIAASACNTALAIGIAAASTFPIPLGYVLTVVPFVTFCVVFFVVGVGPQVLMNSQMLRQQLSAQILAVAALCVMTVAYSGFGAVFNSLAGNEQTALVLMLPVIKFFAKQCVARSSGHLQECIGLPIVFSVDVCNILYVAVCMQTASSSLTTLVMIVVDAFFIVLALHSIYTQSNAARFRDSQSALSRDGGYLMGLVQLTRRTFYGSDRIIGQTAPIRIWSPLPLPLSDESVSCMTELLHTSQQDFHSVSKNRSPTISSRVSSVVPDKQKNELPDICDNKEHDGADTKISNNTLAISPFSERMVSKVSISNITPTMNKVDTSNPIRITSSLTAVRFSSHDDAIQEVQDALQALFHAEYVMMTEYVECAIPLLYAVYLATLFYLPIAAYYPHTRSMTPRKLVNTEVSYMLYALIELTSFAALNLLLRRKLGFSTLYQLAFVLETQVRSVQSFLFLWVLTILQMPLVHNGADMDSPSK